MGPPVSSWVKKPCEQVLVSGTVSLGLGGATELSLGRGAELKIGLGGGFLALSSGALRLDRAARWSLGQGSRLVTTESGSLVEGGERSRLQMDNSSLVLAGGLRLGSAARLHLLNATLAFGAKAWLWVNAVVPHYLNRMLSFLRRESRWMR